MAEDLYYCVDVSNWSGDITGQVNEHNPDRVIVRASQETAAKRDIAVEQCRTAYGMGRGVDLYHWAYPGEDPARAVHADLAIAADAQLPGVGMLLLDTEEGTIESLGPGPMCDWIDAYGNECVNVGVPMMLYTRRSYWQYVTGDSTRCSWLYLMACQIDEVATLESVVPFGGWHHGPGSLIQGKQWSFRYDIDRDIIAQSVYAAPSPPEPPPDPCADLRRELRRTTDQLEAALAELRRRT